MTNTNETRTCWKMLSPRLSTTYNGIETFYPAPSPNEKWSEWMEHPEPGEYDGKDCGPGGYHGMLTKGPDGRYAPDNWWPWFAQVRGVLGESDVKIRATQIRVRRVSLQVFWRIIRLGWCKWANLYRANLYRANLYRANLYRVNLEWANLEWANLDRANLYGANLNRANLYGANLNRANLEWANLEWSNLDRANLYGANLYGANLDGAILYGAILYGANHDQHTRWPENFDMDRLKCPPPN